MQKGTWQRRQGDRHSAGMPPKHATALPSPCQSCACTCSQAGCCLAHLRALHMHSQAHNRGRLLVQLEAHDAPASFSRPHPASVQVLLDLVHLQRQRSCSMPALHLAGWPVHGAHASGRPCTFPLLDVSVQMKSLQVRQLPIPYAPVVRSMPGQQVGFTSISMEA